MESPWGFLSPTVPRREQARVAVLVPRTISQLSAAAEDSECLHKGGFSLPSFPLPWGEKSWI